MDKDELAGKGYSEEEIQRLFEVTKSHVKWIKRNYGTRVTEIPSGLSPDDRLRVFDELKSKGYSDEELTKLGFPTDG